MCLYLHTLYNIFIKEYCNFFNDENENDYINNNDNEENQDNKYIELKSYSNDMYSDKNTVILLNSSNLTGITNIKNKNKDFIEDDFVIINI